MTTLINSIADYQDAYSKYVEHMIKVHNNHTVVLRLFKLSACNDMKRHLKEMILIEKALIKAIVVVRKEYLASVKLERQQKYKPKNHHKLKGSNGKYSTTDDTAI